MRKTKNCFCGKIPNSCSRLVLFLASLFSLLSLTACKQSEDHNNLNIYIWSDYLSKDTLTKFTARTGIHVNFDTYDSNEALLEKLQSGVANYDIIVPSDYMVRVMIKEKLLLPLDHAKLVNLKNLEERFLSQKFDSGNQYSLPYLWGTTGIGYNKEKVKGPVESWNVLFDPKYQGKILMLDDVRECFAVALKSMGKSINDSNAEDLKEAAEVLKNQKSLIKTYNSADFSNILATGDVDFAHGYNGQLAKIVNKQPDKFNYIVPKEGGTLWMDNLCIPIKSQHTEAAYSFLNYLMEPEVSADIVNSVNYASANLAAKSFIKPQILNDPIIYPTEETLTNCEFLEDLGDTATLLDQYWTEIKAK
jgi:spermidine/putrescine-binding protein